MRIKFLATLCVLFAATLAARADTIYNFTITGAGNQPADASYVVNGSTNIDSCATPPDPASCKSNVNSISFTVSDPKSGYNQMFSTIVSQSGTVVNVLGNQGTVAKFTFTDLDHPRNNDTFNLQVPGIDGDFVGHLTGPNATPPPPATPEPSSIALLGTGLLGIAGVLRKRFV